MFVVITENRSGETLLSRRLSPTESLEPEHHARAWAESNGMRLAESDGYIPSGCGDMRVELRPRRDDSVVIWTGRDFFITGEG